MNQRYPVVGMLHLLPLPGAPQYGGSINAVIDQALIDLATLGEHEVDGVIVENFGDVPFYPEHVPDKTVAAITEVARAVRRDWSGALGINVLRNDALAALEIAHDVKAEFIRVNVHMHPTVTEQGILTGRAHHTLRRRAELGAKVEIWTDVAVKHGQPLVPVSIEDEARDLVERGLADALIVSGSRTGNSASVDGVVAVRSVTDKPIWIGSGINADNVQDYSDAYGFIVGSSVKRDGNAGNEVDGDRLAALMSAVRQMRSPG